MRYKRALVVNHALVYVCWLIGCYCSVFRYTVFLSHWDEDEDILMLCFRLNGLFVISTAEDAQSVLSIDIFFLVYCVYGFFPFLWMFISFECVNGIDCRSINDRCDAYFTQYFFSFLFGFCRSLFFCVCDFFSSICIFFGVFQKNYSK